MTAGVRKIQIQHEAQKIQPTSGIGKKECEIRMVARQSEEDEWMVRPGGSLREPGSDARVQHLASLCLRFRHGYWCRCRCWDRRCRDQEARAYNKFGESGGRRAINGRLIRTSEGSEDGGEDDAGELHCYGSLEGVWGVV